MPSHVPGAPRPIRSVLAVAVLFFMLGVLDLWRGAAPIIGGAPRLAADDLEVLAIGLAALVGAFGLLRRQNWARWLLAVWMLLHVVFSVGQPRQLIAHVVIFGFIAYLLFRPAAAGSFGPAAGR